MDGRAKLSQKYTTSFADIAAHVVYVPNTFLFDAPHAHTRRYWLLRQNVAQMTGSVRK